MWIWLGQKEKVKKVCNNSPSQRGEGGDGLLVLVEGQLLHKQGGLTLSYNGQAWKSTCGQQECPPIVWPLRATRTWRLSRTLAKLFPKYVLQQSTPKLAWARILL